MKRLLSLFLFSLIAVSFFGCASTKPDDSSVIHLLKQENFYAFTTNFGLSAESDKVFQWKDGIVQISGEHYGYISTKQDYSHYRLVAEFKWGKKTWAPREKNARDSGVLVNAVGKDQVWPKSLEAQLIEGGSGDVLVVSGAKLTVDGITKGPRIERFDRPGRNPWKDEVGFRGPNEIEKPFGQWNTLEVVCDGEHLIVSVNGHKTIEGTNASPTSGRIVLQSEGAEVFFRRLDLYPLKK